MINIIVACDRNNLIGKNGTLPWEIKKDWEYFLKQTEGGALIMGRHCYEDFEKHAINRTVIALSRNPTQKFPFAYKAASLDEALQKAKALKKTAWICGGHSIYQEAFSIADRLYLTEIDNEYEGNVFLPDWEPFFKNEISKKKVHDNVQTLTFRVLTK